MVLGTVWLIVVSWLVTWDELIIDLDTVAQLGHKHLREKIVAYSYLDRSLSV